MQISQKSPQTFKGYGARPLEYLIIRPHRRINNTDIIKELGKVADKNGIKLILDGDHITDKIPVRKEQFAKYKTDMFVWAQDRLYFYKNKLFNSMSEDNGTILNRHLGLEPKNVDPYHFIAGGNLFFINDRGKEKILVGASESTRKVNNLFGGGTFIKVPQANFHIDMFVRPLKDNVILVADDDMTLNILYMAYNKLQSLVDKGRANEMYRKVLGKLDKVAHNMSNGKFWTEYESTHQVIKTLMAEKFKVVRVPGRVYSYKKDSDINDYINFMNAIVHEKQNGELVYITNDINFEEDFGISYSVAKKIGLDLKRIFRDAVKDYIKPENVFFIRGSKGAEQGDISSILKKYCGGIHCMTVEVPKGILPENISEKFDKCI